MRAWRLWRRFWLGVEDPRAIALVRIVFVFFAICNVNGLWEHFVFLFTDEGILPADVARQVFAAEQFAGFGDGMDPAEPWGFFDLEALSRFLVGPRFSLLYFWDSPTAMWIHVGAFEVAAVLFMVGLWTRASGIVAFVLMTSLFDRNPLFWEGTELVFRVFFAILLFAKSGHAWSLDNWCRCRRLRREHRVWEPVYRPIPVWPRRLMMLQLAAVYVTTGALKSGALWANGDAVYYALNLDHFYRFYPQQLSAVLGTNVLRVVTWVVRFGEIGFGLCFVGAVVRVAIAERPAPRVRWICRWILGRRIWITWAVATMGGIFVVMNIGQFQTAMLALCLVYFDGDEVARALARLRRQPSPPRSEAATQVWAYGVFGRFCTSALLGWHILAVGIWLVPEHDAIEGARKRARALVQPWLEITRSTQGWGMFGPNPPRQNVFMQVLVVDERGHGWDMHSDVYAPERKPMPFLWNDRARKMNRRIIGGESGGGDWYRKWYARWQCRQWALEHDGRVPERVELVQLSYRIPSPDAVRELGWYRPEQRLRDFGASKVVHTERCAIAVLGQPLPVVAERHGIASSVAHRPWVKRRRDDWEGR
jgi:hypothetical protein